MKKLFYLVLLITSAMTAQVYTPVNYIKSKGIKISDTPTLVTGNTKQLVRNSVTGQVEEQTIISPTIPDASETVAGKVSVGTQTFGGNKIVVGQSSSVGNALEIQNLAHTKLVQIANTGVVTLMNLLNVKVSSSSSVAFKLGYGVTDCLGFRGDGTIVSTNSGKFGASNTVDFAHSSAILQADSTAKGFLPPRMTTTQKNAIATPMAGLMVFDTTLMKLCVFTTAWEIITSM